MQVILLEDVKGTGKKGQVVNVSDGHAKNFLIPKKMAAEAAAKLPRRSNPRPESPWIKRKSPSPSRSRLRENTPQL
jgi:large subunit ribosomal protein L9